MGPPALLPLRRKAWCRFLSPLKIIVLAGFEPMNLALHADHYTTDGTDTRFNSTLRTEDFVQLLKCITRCKLTSLGVQIGWASTHKLILDIYMPLPSHGTTTH
jgi:hypothetical protein